MGLLRSNSGSEIQLLIERRGESQPFRANEADPALMTMFPAR